MSKREAGRSAAAAPSRAPADSRRCRAQTSNNSASGEKLTALLREVR